MSIEQLDTVDIISEDKESGAVVLTISDHLDWSDGIRHQTLLQAKLNKYLAFVESGEIVESYPKAKGRPLIFNIAFKFKPDPEGRKFLSKVKEIIESAGVGFRSEIFAESYDN
jgi:hypothetical protein